MTTKSLYTSNTTIVGVVVALLVVGSSCGIPTQAGSDPELSFDGERQFGIALPAWSTDAYRLEWTEQSLDELVALGATWVTLTVTWYQAERRSNCFEPTADTNSDDSLRHALSLAEQRNLQVAVKPMVDLASGQSRDLISPENETSWFGCYDEFVGHYAELAAAGEADLFIVGTELAALSDSGEHWRQTIDVVRDRFVGDITYAANYDEVADVEFWDAVDYVGVDAYWPLSDSPETDVDTLVEAWREPIELMRSIAEEAGKPVLLTELGYVSQEGATTAPFDWERNRPVSQEEQAAAFEAAAIAWQQEPFFAGVHIWMWDDAPGSLEDQTIDYSPRRKLAEQTIRDWFSA